MDDLCIKPGKFAWQLHVDIVGVNHDGNLTDCAVLALLAALRNLRLPSAEVVTGEAGEEVVVSEEWTESVPVHNVPVPLTFGFFHDEQQEGDGALVMIADPTRAEEELLANTVTVARNAAGQLCSVHKPGGVPLTDQQLMQCMVHCQARVPVAMAEMERALAEER